MLHVLLIAGLRSRALAHLRYTYAILVSVVASGFSAQVETEKNFITVVEGRILGSTFRGNYFTLTSERHFIAQIGNGKWRFDSWLTNQTLPTHKDTVPKTTSNSPRKHGDHSAVNELITTVSFDGTNQYRQFHDPSRIRVLPAILDKSHIPYPDGTSHATPLWVGFASKTYFETNTLGEMPPLWQLFSIDSIWYSGSTYTYRKAGQRLMTSLDVFNSGYNFTRPDSKSRRIVRVPLKPPYDAGYLKCRYTASAHTNVGTITLPTHFELTTFRPKPDGRSSNDVQVFEYYIARATKFYVTNSANFVPQLSATNTPVIDMRFNYENLEAFHIYDSPNARWPFNGYTSARRLALARPVALKNLLPRSAKSSSDHGTLVKIAIYLLAATFSLGLLRILRSVSMRSTN